MASEGAWSADDAVGDFRTVVDLEEQAGVFATRGDDDGEGWERPVPSVTAPLTRAPLRYSMEDVQSRNGIGAKALGHTANLPDIVEGIIHGVVEANAVADGVQRIADAFANRGDLGTGEGSFALAMSGYADSKRAISSSV